MSICARCSRSAAAASITASSSPWRATIKRPGLRDKGSGLAGQFQPTLAGEFSGIQGPADRQRREEQVSGVPHAAAVCAYIAFEDDHAQPAAARRMRVSKPDQARAHNAYVGLDRSGEAA